MNKYFYVKKLYNYIIIVFCLLKYNDSLIIFPFKTTNSNTDSSYDFMSLLYSNQLFTNIRLDNKKIIHIVISQEKVAFAINENSYNLKNSSNYNESTLPIPRSFPWEEIDKGILLKDIIFVDFKEIGNKERKEKSLTAKFIYIDNETYSYIGLKFPDLNEHSVISIFKNLKDNELIDNFQWCPIINKKNNNINYTSVEGELIIGANCNDYLPNLFEKKYISEFEMNTHGQYVEYSIVFQNVYLERQHDKNDLYNKKIFFGINFLTIGSIEYEQRIKNLFFNDWFDKNICFMKSMNKYPDFNYIYCNLNFDLKKEFNFNSFPKLCMEYLNSTFCLDNNDLFIQDPKDNKIIYFMIIFKYDYVDDFSKSFHFGLQFLSKYQLSFDPKAHKIYYFGNKDDNKEKEEIEDNNNSSKLYIKIIVIIVLAIILVILGMIIQKALTKNIRKNRANELDDNFLYEEKEEE